MSKERGVGRKLIAPAVVVGLAASSAGIEPAQAKASYVEHQLSKMSLEQKIGQMFLINVPGPKLDKETHDMIAERKFGGVIYFKYNLETPQQTKKLSSDLQKVAEPNGIPLLIACDEEGGRIARMPWEKKQPSGEELGNSGDPARAEKMAQEIGKTMKEVGMNTNFAPDLDTGHGAAIGDRSFSDNPAVVAKMGAAEIKGYNEVGIIPTGKHFPNHGDAKVDSHIGLPVVNHDMKTIVSRDLPSFKKAVEAGVPMLMAAHLVYPSIDKDNPISLSKKGVAFLRKELNFQNGVVITDSLSMEGARQGKTTAETAVKALKAGDDILMVLGTHQDQRNAYDGVIKAVKSGEVSEKQINTSVKRILSMKEKYLNKI